MYQSHFSYDEQLEELATLIEDCHTRKSKHVRGEYASNDYVTWRLNQIFTPSGWNFEILTGPAYTTISESMAFVQLTGRLTVTFANGATAFRDEVGVWPMYAKEANGHRLLDASPPEMYELVLKASLSDCLKACAERFGNTFRPLLDAEFRGWLGYEQEQIRSALREKPDITADQAVAELFEADRVDEITAEDYTGSPIDADAHDDLKDEPRVGKDTSALTVDLGFVPDFSDWNPGKEWGRFRTLAQVRLGFNHANHVKNTMSAVINNEEKAKLTYASAWTRLADYQKSKQANGETS